MNVTIDDKWRVNATHSFAVPLKAERVWGQMRDFRRFVTRDPLHARVLDDPDSPSDLIIRHQLLGMRVDRRSRILRWREGHGYVFSDLSRRGNCVGFPHVCSFEVVPRDAGSAVLTIGARGRWTARFVPRYLVAAWIRWVLATTAEHVRAELRSYALCLRSRRSADITREAAPRDAGSSPARDRDAR